MMERGRGGGVLASDDPRDVQQQKDTGVYAFHRKIKSALFDGET